MILVTGATGYTGRFLLRRLVETGQPLRCLVRPASARADLDRYGVEVCTGDLENPEGVRPAFAGVRMVLHLAHIRYTPTIIACAGREVERMVLVSSLRRFSRVPSASVDEVRQGEDCAMRAGIPCTILRPAMIYGPGDDRNISRLAAYLRRSRWFPIFGTGRALQQPVYVEDVVAGLLAAAQRSGTAGKAYALAGAEALTYERLIDMVGETVGVKPVKVHVPVSLALAGVWCLERLGVRLGVGSEQILRLQEDKVFSVEEARADLGYEPLSFAEGLARVYGGEREP